MQLVSTFDVNTKEECPAAFTNIVLSFDLHWKVPNVYPTAVLTQRIKKETRMRKALYFSTI